MVDNDDYSRLVETARSDERVLGLVLTGSRGRRVFVSPASDWDVRLVVRDDDLAGCVERFATPHGSLVEVAVFSLSSFERAGAVGSPNEGDRYSYAHAEVVLDKLGGQIGALVSEKGLLSPVAAREIAERALDTYINSFYRSAKNLRNGLAVEAQLDAAESISPFLTALLRCTSGFARSTSSCAGSWRSSRSETQGGAREPSCHGSGRSLLPAPSPSNSVYFGTRNTSCATGDSAMSWTDGSLMFSGFVARLNSLAIRAS
jgi:hypothetical protein